MVKRPEAPPGELRAQGRHRYRVALPSPEPSMRRLTASLFALALGLSSLAAQTTANDVGLTMDGGVLPVIYGQTCGAVTCTPFMAGAVSPSAVRTVTVWAASGTPCILAIGLPGVCFPFPGIANPLLLNGPVTLAVGVTVSPGPQGARPCLPGYGFYAFPLNVPATAPTGWTFRLQALATTFAAGVAFTPALEVNI
jgi:hypothetical protein